MKKLFLLFLLPLGMYAQTKALVGGTLIDGYGNEPLKNSVILIEGETIVKVGSVNNTSIPEGAEE